MNNNEDSFSSSSANDNNDQQQQQQQQQSDNIVASTATGTTNSNNYNNLIVAASLLSIAKDYRYIKQIQTSILDALEPIFGDFRSDSGRSQLLLVDENLNQQSSLSKINLSTWYISFLLYILTTTKFSSSSSGQTIGMEMTGLKFFEPSPPQQKQQNKNGGKNNSKMYGFVALSMMLGISTFVLDCFLESKRRSSSSDNNNGTSIINNNSRRNTASSYSLPSTTSQYESLRGMDRRQIYERMRQQMLLQHNAASTTSTTTSNRQRQQQQQQQREETPAVSSSSSSSESINPSSRVNTLSSSSSSRLQKYTKIINQIFKTILGSNAFSESPHYPSSRTNTNQAAASTSSSYSLLSWIIRLHLAQYCITGKYPSLLHRTLGLQLVGKAKTTTTTAGGPNIHPLPPNYNTIKYVGFIIGLQFTVSTSRNIINWFATKIAQRTLQQQIGRQRRQEHNHHHHHQQLSKKKNYLFPLLEDDDTTNECQNRLNGNNQSTSTTKTASASLSSCCAICRSIRTNPAAPSTCGHVFCWNCLIQWVTTVRPECPLCRTKCRPQDVLPLYNYDGG